MTKKSQHGAARGPDRGAAATQPHGDRMERIRPTLTLSDLQDISEPSRFTSGLNETAAAYQRAVDQVRASMHTPAIEQLAKQLQDAQQAHAKLVNDSGLSKAIAAQQRMAEQMRVDLHLSEVEQSTDRGRTSMHTPAIEQLARQLQDVQQAYAKLVNDSGLSRMIVAQQGIADQMRAYLPLSEAGRLAKRIDEAMGSNIRHGAELQSAKDLARAAASAMPAPSHRSSAPPPPQLESADNDPSTAITSARDLGRLVRQARKRRRLSQQAFADLVGVGRRFISELEQGKPTLEFGKVLQVAAATGIDVLARFRG